MANLYECGGGSNIIVFPRITLIGYDFFSEVKNNVTYIGYKGGYFYLPNGVKKISINSALYQVPDSEGTHGELIVCNSTGIIRSFSFLDGQASFHLNVEITGAAPFYIYARGESFKSGTTNPVLPRFVLQDIYLYM